MEALRRLVELVDAGHACVLATVVHVRGSAPRGPGARLVLDASGTAGTVGGGEIEDAVLVGARALLADPAARVRTLDHVTRCGGVVTVMLERFGPARPLVVVGAGRVGCAIARAAASAGFAVTVIDRAGAPELSDAGDIAMKTGDQPSALLETPEPAATQVVVATGSHDADIAWAVAALQAGFAGVGVIGSRTKGATAQRAAEAAGIPPERLGALRCPVGLDLGSITPAEIAVAVVAELVLLAQRGEVPEVWRKPARE